MRTLTTVFDPNHMKHDPVGFRGVSEFAERGERLIKAVREMQAGDILSPADFGLAPILAVHPPHFVAFLQTAYEDFSVVLGKEVRGVVPDTFPTITMFSPEVADRPVNIWGQLGKYCFDTAAPIMPATWQTAYQAAQVTLTATQLVYEGAEVAYALCRPPGHHAAQAVYGGYCYLNNVAIGAQWLTDKGQRVAILDVDYHHGNGTQQIFYDRADVLFCSIHADPAVEYPYFVGYADEVGKNATSGASIFTNYNYPLPRGTAEPEYFVALDQAIQQIADFAPDTLLISLGFDTLEGDPVGGFALQTDSFQRMAERISALHLPTILVQEGGYALDLLGQNLTAFLHGFLAE